MCAPLEVVCPCAHAYQARMSEGDNLGCGYAGAQSMRPGDASMKGGCVTGHAHKSEAWVSLCTCVPGTQVAGREVRQT